MSFEVAAQAYDQFMGAYSEPLADQFVDWVGVAPGSRALDVGCGPGALTARLVARLGADAVAAVDPSAPFVGAAQERLPGVDVRQARAESLPHDDGEFDLVLAQLVVHFMTDPVSGITQMRRVARPGGLVAANVWDHAGDRGPLSLFWKAARDLDPSAPDESSLPGVREGHLAELFTEAGLHDVEADELQVVRTYPTFDDWWHPYTLGVGPAGDHVKRLDGAGVTALRERCRDRLPDGPIEVVATAWAARSRV